MNTKVNKTKKQAGAKWKTIRMRESMKISVKEKLKEINLKESGRDLKLDEVIVFALQRLTEGDTKLLQARSLSNTDRQEILRKKYSELYGSVTPEEFVGVTMTLEYFNFLKEHGQSVSVA